MLIGTGTYHFARAAEEQGYEVSRLVFAEDQSVAQIFETIVGRAGRGAVVMGLGNIGGPGLELVRYFRNREAPLAPAAGA